MFFDVKEPKRQKLREDVPHGMYGRKTCEIENYAVISTNRLKHGRDARNNFRLTYCSL
jgi:hypothetical protein